jgi:Zn-dependent protease
MKSSWRVGRVMGIDLYLDLGWFVIVALLIYTLGFIEFPRELHPRAMSPRADVTSVTLGVLASLLLFASVLAHEFAHAWMALQRGIGVKRITLFIFGGVAHITDEPERPASEFLIAVVGPLTSLALTAVFGAMWVWLMILDATHLFGRWLAAPILLTSVLTQVNGSLALFNLAPGFPLDGGRLLRAFLWSILHDLRRATLWTSRIGQLIALILIGAGAAVFFIGSSSIGIWYGLIGLFLWNAASEGYRQTVLLEVLRRVPVSAVMIQSVETVPPDISLGEFAETYVLPRRDQTFVVSDGVTTLGMIAHNDLKDVPRATWQTRRVRDVMTPLAQLPMLTPQQNAASALAQLATSEREELPVIEHDQIVGFVGHESVSRYLKLKVDSK